MPNIFFISDTHFFDKEILTFFDHNNQRVRSFSSVEEMNETIVDNWNKVVSDQDTVYHLGDVFSTSSVSEEDFENLWFRLKGKKKLAIGNHDRKLGLFHSKSAKFNRYYFRDIQVWFKLKDKNIFASHDPKHISTLFNPAHPDKPYLNVHGHIHTLLLDGPYRNVCVENTRYTPINIEEI